MRDRIGSPILRVGTGNVPLSISFPVAQPPAAPAKIYAFAVPLKGGIPKMFVFDDNPDGLHELANLVRGERVLGVVRGHKVTIEASNTVSLEIQGQRILDRIPLSE